MGLELGGGATPALLAGITTSSIDVAGGGPTGATKARGYLVGTILNPVTDGTNSGIILEIYDGVDATGILLARLVCGNTLVSPGSTSIPWEPDYAISYSTGLYARTLAIGSATTGSALVYYKHSMYVDTNGKALQ